MEKKYSKILNNLLSIKARDQSIITRVNGFDSFDISSKFGNKNAEKLLNQKNFKIALKENDLEEILKVLKKKNVNFEEIIQIFEKYKEKLSNSKKLLLEKRETFESEVKDLSEKIEIKIQKTNSRWKQFERKAIDINIQENVWPLHIATCFIKILTSKKAIYAPFLLREVQINIFGTKMEIQSLDDWKFNEKVIFLLNSQGFNFPENFSTRGCMAFQCLEIINNHFRMNLKLEDLLGNFQNTKSQEIKNQKVVFCEGVILGLFKPSGGNLRKTMLKIIQNEEVDEIIDIDPDKTIYQKEVQDFIENKYNDLLKIQPSNYSQDKALSSALMQDTIIWGPPGTGKSQVIANIIANVLYTNQKAVVVSQKKAALDVLKKRLGKISHFVLFILNDNKTIKADFYKPLQKFLELVEENFSEDEERKYSERLSLEEKEAIKIITKAKTPCHSNKYVPSLKILDIFKQDKGLINSFMSLNPDLNYPDHENKRFKEYLYLLTKTNQISKKGLIFKRFDRNTKRSAKCALKVLNESTCNLNEAKKFISKTSTKTIFELMNIPNMLQRNNDYCCDEEYLVSQLCKSIMNKIRYFKASGNYLMTKKYKKFTNAIRAARRLPFKFVNDHEEILKELFPVIITTPETNFINWEKNSFDYAILDESSQIFLEIGLPILYLSKKKILAGDRKQMQPSRWFETRDDSETDDIDIAENATSVLDYAFDKGVHQIMLNKNYRSASAALMSFSSKHFYESKLEVIDALKSKDSKPIEVFNVNGKWEKNINEEEAQKVISLCKDNLKNYKKIIILTFNSHQRQLIEKVIIENQRELLEAMEKEQIMIRNIENIQGDEADLVIASIVYDENTNIASTYVARQGGENALNVAISRAKNKIIVVKSVSSKTIKNANSKDFQMFKKWLEFLDDSEKGQKNYSLNNVEESYGQTDSNFEEEVKNLLIKKIKTRKKFKLVKQYEIGSKKIDLAFIDQKNKFKLGIEVDGYKYHGAKGIDKYLEDYSRQEFLESKGYNIFRIKELDWVISKEEILRKIGMLLN